MAYQLIYTSYSSSLIQGRTGFSTVAMSETLPANLVSEIQRISQYDIPSGVVFAHRIISFGGGKYHILTRTKDCGLDYTNRNNYIAHHLIFTEAEVDRIYVNPADVMLAFPLWCDLFSGQPRYIPELSLSDFNSKRVLFLPARNWQTHFGDCAYAATIFNKPAVIKADVSNASLLLKLYDESLLLFREVKEMWSVPFTTQLLPSDKRVDFVWCASSSVSSFDADVDVVNAKAKVLPTDRSAEYARTGVMTNTERYNLKISDNISKNRNFNVVDFKKSRKPLVAGIVALLAIVAAVGYFCLNSLNSSKQFKEPVGKESKVVAVERSQTLAEDNKSVIVAEVKEKQKSLSETLSLAREKIDSGDFSGAIEVWNDCKHPNKSNYDAIVQGDISAKIDAMFSFAENVSLNPLATQSQKKQAIKYLRTLRLSGEFISESKRDFILSKSSELLKGLQKK